MSTKTTTASSVSRWNAQTLTIAAMFCALAYVAALVGRIPLMPAAPFLDYDPKDVIIVLGGLILGPMPALLIAAVAALLEWFTFSTTGPIGFLMNFLSSGAFAFTASLIYQKKKTLAGAVIGLVSGVVAMAVVMLIWNYIATPLYMNVDRATVARMLPTVFLPFNLLKGGINAALSFLLYRPVLRVLKAARLMPKSAHSGKQTYVVPLLVAVLVLVSCVLVVLSMNGVF